MNRNFGTRIVATLAVLVMPVTLAAQEQTKGLSKRHGRYTLIDVGTLGGPNSSFQAGAPVVNDKGTATGWADTPEFDPDLGIPVFHAFKWKKGVLTDLGALPGGSISGSQAINSRGVISGFSTTGIVDPVFGSEFVATLWRANGQIVDLGTLGGARSIAVAMNDRGQVVGAATNAIPDPDGLGGAVTDSPRRPNGTPPCGRTEQSRIWGRWGRGRFPLPTSSTRGARSRACHPQIRFPTRRPGCPPWSRSFGKTAIW